MGEGSSHLDEVLRLYSEELVPAVAKLSEIEARIPMIVESLEEGLSGVRRRFLDGLQRDIETHRSSGQKLTDAVESTRVQLLALQTELTKAAAESVGRDLRAALVAIQETATELATKASTEAVRRVLIPATTEVVGEIRKERQRLGEAASETANRLIAVTEQATLDVATLNFGRWVIVGVLVLGMSFLGMGVWRAIDDIWPWKLTADQSVSLAVGKAVRESWDTFDPTTQQKINRLMEAP